MIEKGKICGKGEDPGPPVWFEEEDVQEAVAGAPDFDSPPPLKI